MWTKQTNKTENQEFEMNPVIARFAQRNPSFAQHHLKTADLIKESMGRYLKTGIPEGENITKIVLKLTRSCNLRCQMCFQWRESGYHHSLKENHLSYDSCGNLFSFLEKHPVDIVFTGGELMLNPDFPRFVKKFGELGCFMYLCTNGTLIDRHYDLLRPYHDKIAFLISIDGPQEVNDRIRGENTYKRVMKNISKLVKAKDEEGAGWIIGAECTMTPDSLDYLDQTLDLVQDNGIDWMVFNHLWLADQDARDEYIEFCKNQYDMVPDSYTGFDLAKFDDTYINKIQEKVAMIREANPLIPVYISPDFSPEEIDIYYRGSLPARSNYLKPGIKLDININGDVVLTKQFPDIVLGNIFENDIPAILESELYRDTANLFREKSLRLLNSCPDSYNFS